MLLYTGRPTEFILLGVEAYVPRASSRSWLDFSYSESIRTWAVTRCIEIRNTIFHPTSTCPLFPLVMVAKLLFVKSNTLLYEGNVLAYHYSLVYLSRPTLTKALITSPNLPFLLSSILVNLLLCLSLLTPPRMIPTLLLLQIPFSLTPWSFLYCLIASPKSTHSSLERRGKYTVRKEALPVS